MIVTQSLPKQKEDLLVEDVDGQDAEAVVVLDRSRWTEPEILAPLEMKNPFFGLNSEWILNSLLILRCREDVIPIRINYHITK